MKTAEDLKQFGIYRGDTITEDTIENILKIINPPVWIDVNDRLPKESQTVLVFNGERRVFPAEFTDERFQRYFDPCTNNSSGFIDRIAAVYYTTITHWMPLPDKPF